MMREVCCGGMDTPAGCGRGVCFCIYTVGLIAVKTGTYLKPGFIQKQTVWQSAERETSAGQKFYGR